MYTRRKPRSDKTFWAVILIELAVLAGLGGIWLRRHREPTSGEAIQTAQLRSDAPVADAPIFEPVQRPVGRIDAREREAVRPQPRPELPALRQPSIIVEKAKRRLHVLDQGKRVKSYVCAVGGSPGDKVREGDLRTPEGRFFVCVKNATSRYTRALGLSYPEVEDARRGLQSGLITRAQYDHILSELEMGRRPPWDTALGGEIMIHGQRGGSDRPTEGCIALEDPDVLELFSRIPVGTPVYIRP
jgi:lipoprotein-anchoring transpeptidase ErfK/SrfK